MLRALILIILVALFGDYSLVMLILGWITRLLLVVTVAIICIVSVMTYEKHHTSDRFDDRLTDQRMRESIEWLIREVKKKHV